VLNGIVNQTEANHFDLSLITRCDQSHPVDLLDALIAGKMEGVVIVAPKSDSRLLPLLKEKSLPMVVIDGDPSQCDNNFVIHNFQAVKIAIAHLAELGHTRIGYIAGPQDHFAARARKDAFFEVMTAFGLPINLEWIQVGAFTFQSGVEGARRILRSETLPTAIFCANDEIAFGVMNALQEMGLNVPNDVSIVGFDNVPLAIHSHPPLTTVRHPVDEISQAAASALIRYIETGTRIGSMTFPGELILRKSTATPPLDRTS
jgi:DNA-binding LacI/PurR family transcriptional regulator